VFREYVEMKVAGRIAGKHRIAIQVGHLLWNLLKVNIIWLERGIFFYQR